MSVNFVAVQPGGLCFTHGPYESDLCPYWPSCIKGPYQGEFVERGLALTSIPILERAVIDHAITFGANVLEYGKVDIEMSMLRHSFKDFFDAVEALTEARAKAQGQAE